MPYAHLELINDALLRIYAGTLKNLIIEMPPRHGKSQMVSEYASGWFAAHGLRVVLASYEAKFASSWGLKSRNHIRDFGQAVFGPGAELTGRDNIDWWELANGGTMICAGVNGSITGKGYDVGIIDDPVKNAEEADSEVYRQNAKDWYDSTWLTRKEPGAAQIIIMTRWHEDDLVGYVTSKADGDVWERISLPALCDDPQTDLLERELGEPLCPERFDRQALLEIKDAIPPRWFGALYQQKPAADEGALFPRKNWLDYLVLPQLGLLRGCITVDTAGWQKTDTSADWCAWSAWGMLDPKLYLADMDRGHWEFVETVDRLIAQHHKYFWPVVVEETPWAKPLVQQLRDQIPGVVGIPPVTSKENRARAVMDIQHGLQAYIPKHHRHRTDWVEEHASFPYGMHDDWVDNTTLAWQYLRRGGGGRRQDRDKNVKAYQRMGGRAKA